MKFDFDELRLNIDNIQAAGGEMFNMLDVNENMTYNAIAINDIKSTLHDIADILEYLCSKHPEE